MSKVHVGCTIGPIFDTLNKAREPGEIWLASYMFSRFAQAFTTYLLGKGIEPLSPSKAGCDIANQCKGIGLYSDHIFFTMDTAENTVDEMIQHAKASAIDELAKDMAKAIYSNPSVGDDGMGKKESISEWLSQAIFVLYVNMDAKDDNECLPMHVLTKQLDLLECYPPYVDRMDATRPDYLVNYLEKAYRSEWIPSFLKRVSFVELASSAQTAAVSADVKTDTETENGSEPNTKVDTESENDGESNTEADTPNESAPASEGEKKENKKRKRSVTDYIAFVQADGDSMGKLLERLSVEGNADALRQVSAFLFKQGKLNAKKVIAYGGLPIYFGGDDMLFAAPMYTSNADKETKSIYSFVKELSDDFEENWKQLITGHPYIGTQVTPSLSFGISVCYKKHPLRFIRDSAASALFHDAKHAEWSGKRSKKSVAIHQHKHSGQSCSVTLPMAPVSSEAESTYTKFLKLCENKNLNTLRLHSLHWKVFEQEEIIAYILTQVRDTESREKRLIHWLMHNYNESGLSTKDIETIVRFMTQTADDNINKDNAKDTILKTLDAVFRINELLHAEEDDHD